jgi:hypothetical protein
MSTIKWQRGKFLKFYAKMKIRIGGKDNTIDKIEQDDEFEYDGSILKYAGAEISSTQLRGAIEGGWASLSQDDDTPIEAFSPTRNVAKATTINRDLSRVQRGGVDMSTDSLDEETVLEVSDRGKMEKARGGASPKIMTRDHNRRGMSVSASDVDSQEGVTIGRVRSAAKLGAVDVAANPGLASQLENRGLGQPMLAKGKVVYTEGVTIRTSVSDIDRSAAVIGGEEEGVVVGKVRHTKPASTEGISVKDTSNIRAGSVAAEAAKPRKAVEIDAKLPAKIRMARRIDPMFPMDWSFTGRLADRLKAAQDHGATSQFLEALYAAEGDQMRHLLEREYPKQFK